MTKKNGPQRRQTIAAIGYMQGRCPRRVSVDVTAADGTIKKVSMLANVWAATVGLMRRRAGKS